jgi:hypothetical protein
MKVEWEKFLLEEITLKAAREQAAAAKIKAEEDLKRVIDEAKRDGTYVQDKSGCHARGVQAILQIQSTTGWVDFKPIEGWVDSPGCPATHPVQPWNIIESQSAIELRWRIWSPGSWEAFTKPNFYYPVIKITPTPTPTPTASAEPKVVVTSRPNPKSTITCIKGKSKKKVIAIKPKCPTGYKIQK